MSNQNEPTNPVAKEKRNAENPMSDQSILWGMPLQFWDVWGIRLLVAGAIGGAVVVLLTFTSAYVLYRVADQAQADLKTTSDANAVELENQKQRTAEALQAASSANERAATAEDRAASANERAAKVEQAARWRVLEPDTKTALALALSKGPGGTVTLAWPANDPESLFLASQIEGEFQAANAKAGKALWNVAFEPRVFSRAIYWGLRIIGQSEPLLAALRKSFLDAGIPNSPDLIPNVINDSPGMTITGDGLPDALIWVGPKRPPN
jgi:hypothetical protein